MNQTLSDQIQQIHVTSAGILNLVSEGVILRHNILLNTSPA